MPVVVLTLYGERWNTPPFVYIQSNNEHAPFSSGTYTSEVTYILSNLYWFNLYVESLYKV